MMEYNAHDWYWIIDDDDTRVWSSARTQYVPSDDTDYQAWRAAGNRPSRIASEDELREVIENQAPDLAGIMTPEQLFDQFTQQQWADIKQASKTDLQVEYLLDRLRVVRTVNPSSQRLIDGLNYLVAQGLIDQATADGIIGSGLSFD